MVTANWQRYELVLIVGLIYDILSWFIIYIYIIYIYIYLGWTPMRAVPGSASSCSPDSPDSPKTPWPRTHKFQFHKLGNGGEALRWYTGCRCSSHHRFLYKSPGAQTGRWFLDGGFSAQLRQQKWRMWMEQPFQAKAGSILPILRIGVENTTECVET